MPSLPTDCTHSYVQSLRAAAMQLMHGATALTSYPNVAQLKNRGEHHSNSPIPRHTSAHPDVGSGYSLLSNPSPEVDREPPPSHLPQRWSHISKRLDPSDRRSTLAAHEDSDGDEMDDPDCPIDLQWRIAYAPPQRWRWVEGQPLSRIQMLLPIHGKFMHTDHATSCTYATYTRQSSMQNVSCSRVHRKSSSQIHP